MSLTPLNLEFALFKHPNGFLALLLCPAASLAWHRLSGLAVRLPVPRFFSIDEFSGFIKYEFTLSTFAELFRLSNFDVIIRSLVMATAVTLASVVIAFPFAYFAARYARGKWKALFYILVMLPLWSSYLVKVYAWKLILAKEGIISWLAGELHLTWAARCPAGNSGHRRPIAVHQLPRHLPGLRLCLAALHDPADAGRTRARAGQPHRRLLRSRREPRRRPSAT